MSARERLERLREILYDPPSPEGWQRLCGLFSGWPEADPDLLLGVDYAAPRLDVWPARLRNIPPGLGLELVPYEHGAVWRDRYGGLRQNPHPAWSLGRALDLSGLVGGLRVAELDALVQWPHLARIEALDLTRTMVGLAYEEADDAIVALSRSPHMGRWSALWLGHCGFGARGLSFLVGTRDAAGLEHLDLCGNFIDDKGVTFLSASPHLTRLDTLSLSGNRIRDPGARALSRAAGLASVRHLTLGNNLLTDRALASLIPSPLFKNLVSLDLSRCRLSDASVRGLIDGGLFRTLRSLDLSDNGLGAASARALASCSEAAGLTELNVDANPIGDEGRGFLARSPHLRASIRLQFAIRS